MSGRYEDPSAPQGEPVEHQQDVGDLPEDQRHQATDERDQDEWKEEDQIEHDQQHPPGGQTPGQNIAHTDENTYQQNTTPDIRITHVSATEEEQAEPPEGEDVNEQGGAGQGLQRMRDALAKQPTGARQPARPRSTEAAGGGS
jgi:hypothetical protein